MASNPRQLRRQTKPSPRKFGEVGKRSKQMRNQTVVEDFSYWTDRMKRKTIFALGSFAGAYISVAAGIFFYHISNNFFTTFSAVFALGLFRLTWEFFEEAGEALAEARELEKTGRVALGAEHFIYTKMLRG